jgi:hypothetical protein
MLILRACMRSFHAGQPALDDDLEQVMDNTAGGK